MNSIVVVKSDFTRECIEKELAVVEPREDKRKGIEFLFSCDGKFALNRGRAAEIVIMARDRLGAVCDLELADISAYFSRQRPGSRVSAPFVIACSSKSPKCEICSVAKDCKQIYYDLSECLFGIMELVGSSQQESSSTLPESDLLCLLADAALAGWQPPDSDFVVRTENRRAAIASIEDRHGDFPASVGFCVVDAAGWLLAQATFRGDPALVPEYNFSADERDFIADVALSYLVESEDVGEFRSLALRNRNGKKAVVLFEGREQDFRRYLRGVLICSERELPLSERGYESFENYGFPNTAASASPAMPARRMSIVRFDTNKKAEKALKANDQGLMLMIVPDGTSASLRQRCLADYIEEQPVSPFADVCLATTAADMPAFSNVDTFRN